MNDIDSKPSGAGDVLTIGFGTAVSMWTVGYLMRKPEVEVGGPVLAAGLLVCLLIGGFLAGRLTSRGWRGGMMAGFVVAGLNLLIVGGTLSDEQQMTSWVLLWVPGTLAVTAIIMALAAMVGGRYIQTNEVGTRRRRVEEEFRRGINWTGWFAIVAVAATALLLAAGGFVTGRAGGLAVPDWPQSYGYNMFFYPLARMTGNIYYEHTHRLLGALVGLTTIALALHLWIVWTKRWWAWAAGIFAIVLALGVGWGALMSMGWSNWVPLMWLIGTAVMVLLTPAIPALRRNPWPWLAGVAVVAVIAQGVMGGYRVSLALTGEGVEVASAQHETSISTILRVSHGVFAQLFFALMVALTLAASKVWQRAQGSVGAMAPSTDRGLSVALILALVGQLILGAMVRHVAMGPMTHIAVAALLTVLAVAVGVRAWGLYGQREVAMKRMGITLLVLVGLQVLLGISALIVTSVWPTVEASPPMMRVLVTTAHQMNGAALLAAATITMLLNFRVLRAEPGWRWAEEEEPKLPGAASSQ
ncbi:MAG: hypothetical protein WD079_07565, partial [Phycisphaeraceae bacterium]